MKSTTIFQKFSHDLDNSSQQTHGTETSVASNRPLGSTPDSIDKKSILSFKKWICSRYLSLKNITNARQQRNSKELSSYDGFINQPYINSPLSPCGETSDKFVEQLMLEYISGMRNRLEAYLSSESTCDEAWASVWIQEEACLEVSHTKAMTKLCRSNRSGRIFTYLCERKERVLDFLWSICRDATNSTLQKCELLQALDTFTYREERILHLYTVKFIHSFDVNKTYEINCRH